MPAGILTAEGTFEIEMNYGNPLASKATNPKDVFAFYEDFEGEGEMGGSLFKPVQPCTLA